MHHVFCQRFQQAFSLQSKAQEVSISNSCCYTFIGSADQCSCLQNSGWRDICSYKPATLYRMTIGIGLVLFQQVTGNQGIVIKKLIQHVFYESMLRRIVVPCITARVASGLRQVMSILFIHLSLALPFPDQVYEVCLYLQYNVLFLYVC